MRVRITVPAAAGVLLALYTITAPAAFAQDPVALYSAAAKQCLEDYEDTVRVYECDGTAEQLWTMDQGKDDIGDVTSLRNGLSGRCLEVYDGQVRTYDCDGTLEQRWDILPGASTGTATLHNARTKTCLSTYQGAPVTVEDCDFLEEQQWTWD